MNDVQNAIKILQNSIWIPVSDRLPEKGKDVLITARDKQDGEYIVEISAYIDSYYGRECWREPFEYFYSNYKVIAWKPLPDPYQGE